MDVTVDRVSLGKAVDQAAGGAAGRTTLPVLNCVLLRADPAAGAVSVAATDNEVYVRVSVAGAEVRAGGACLVPADKLAAWLRDCPAGPLRVKADGAGVKLSCGRAKADGAGVKLSCGRAKAEFPFQDPALFPEVGVPDGPAVVRFELPAGELVRHLRRVRGAAGQETDRGHVLGGVLVETGPGGIVVVATDSKRMSSSEGPVRGGPATGSCILPQKAVGLVPGLLPDPGEGVSVAFDRGLCAFATGRSLLVTRQISGQFPPHRQFVVQFTRGVTDRVELPAAAAAGACRQVAGLGDVEMRKARFELAAGVLSVTAVGSAAGTAGSAEVEVPGYDGPAWVDHHDPDVVGQVLKAAGQDGCEAVRVEFGATGHPLLFRPADGWLYALMPMGD